MNAFEQLVADCLFREGYWTITAFKVELSKEEKQTIGRPSSPRWELDIVAYRPATKDLMVVECKSYLDSQGVNPSDLKGTGKNASRYKLFTDRMLWRVVSDRLVKQLKSRQLIHENVKPRLALAYGKSKDEAALNEMAESNGWQMFGPRWLCEALDDMAADGWQNSTSSIAAKLLRTL